MGSVESSPVPKPFQSMRDAMNTIKPFLSFALLAAVVVAGCSRESEPAGAALPDAATTAPTPVEPTTDAAPAPAVASAKLIWADALATCDADQVTTVHWSPDTVATGPALIEIGDGAAPGLFASVGAGGDKETGPWAAPGVILVLRRADDRSELGRVVLEGPADCP